MKNTFEIVVLNQKFTIRSEADEKHVKKVADWVNKKMHEVGGANKSMSSLQVSLLAALNMADDYFKLKKNTQEKTQEWMSLVQQVINQLENS